MRAEQRNTSAVKIRSMYEPILPAHRQIAEQLLELIRVGALGPGDRLPPETALAAQFGASRSTIRRAIQVLTLQSLVETRRGSCGGTFVVKPDISMASARLENKLAVLSAGKEFATKDLLAVCAILEIPGAAIAARRRTEDDMRLLIRSEQREPRTSGALGSCEAFHVQLLAATGNALLPVLGNPTVRVLMRVLAPAVAQTGLGIAAIRDEHRRILRCVSGGDATGATAAMSAHYRTLSHVASACRGHDGISPIDG